MINKSSIENILRSYSNKVLSYNELSPILNAIKGTYGYKLKSRIQIIEILVKHKLIYQIFLFNEKRDTPKTVYSIQQSNPDIYKIGASLSRSSYFSHQTAISIHSLSLQIPKNIYLTYERNTRQENNDILTQEKIDVAFSKNPRISKHIYIWNNYSFYLLESQSYNKIGIDLTKNTTDLERMLIDITIRPFYAGGVLNVLDIYKKVKDKIDIKKLLLYYTEMNFIYPYHQAIGFYLEKSGYADCHITYFNNMHKEFDFYLTYNILHKEYSSKWKLFYPKGL